MNKRENNTFSSGDPIQCINDRGVPPHVINTYCWITYTFTLPHEQGKLVGIEVAHPGLGNENQEKRYHSYYQWVPFVLFFQVSYYNLALLIYHQVMFLGRSILHSALVLEELGTRQNPHDFRRA